MHNDLPDNLQNCYPEDDDWGGDDVYDWDDPDWREETDWSDLYGSDMGTGVKRSDIVESRD